VGLLQRYLRDKYPIKFIEFGGLKRVFKFNGENAVGKVKNSLTADWIRE
jgi:hypothetical protein